MALLNIIYASTSGNTEYVVDMVVNELTQRATGLEIKVLRAEKARTKDLADGDVLVLASGTWNMSGNEGQLNPHMYKFLSGPISRADLVGKPCAVIGLGDTRYRYTAHATHHLSRFIEEHGGRRLVPPLVIVDEPHGQEKRIAKWASKLSSALIAL